MLDRMWDQIEPQVKRWVREYAPWATFGNVTSLSPLTVQPDGPSDPMLPSASLADGLRVGDRVYMLTFAGRAIIIGSTGGGGAPYAMAAGSISVTANGGIGSARVNFPTGRFTQTPIITISAHSGSDAVVNAQIDSPSTSGFDAVLLRTTDTATRLHWHAIQMTANDASG